MKKIITLIGDSSSQKEHVANIILSFIPDNVSRIWLKNSQIRSFYQEHRKFDLVIIETDAYHVDYVYQELIRSMYLKTPGDHFPKCLILARALPSHQYRQFTEILYIDQTFLKMYYEKHETTGSIGNC